MSKLKKYKTFKDLKMSDKNSSNSDERRALMIADLNDFVNKIQDSPRKITSTSAEKL